MIPNLKGRKEYTVKSLLNNFHPVGKLNEKNKTKQNKQQLQHLSWNQ